MRFHLSASLTTMHTAFTSGKPYFSLIEPDEAIEAMVFTFLLSVGENYFERRMI